MRLRKVHDAEDDEGMDTEMVSADAGKDRPDSESPFPPTENVPIAFPFFSPLMRFTMRAASGWKSALPTPQRMAAAKMA